MAPANPEPNYKDLDGIIISFISHPNIKGFHTALNNIYAGGLPDIEPLFEAEDPSDPNSTQRFRLTQDVVATLQALILRDLIAGNLDTGADINAAKQILLELPLKVIHKGNLYGSRLTRKSLMEAIRVSLSNGTPHMVDIVIPTAKMGIKVNPTTYLNWAEFTTDPGVRVTFQGPTNPTGAVPPPAPAAFTASQADTKAHTESIKDLTEAIRNLNQNRQSSSQNQSPSVLGSRYLFNAANLPADVKKRWEDKKNRVYITGSTVGSPFQGGHRYHLDGSDRLILSDGTFFLISEFPREKEFLRNLLTCKDDTHSGIRAWYETFGQHARDHNLYVHPLWAFRKNHGGNWGFTVGDGPNDDLPGRMSIAIAAMTQPIFLALQKSDMFPKDSRCQDIVRQCNGDGYQALKQIIYASHPVFHEQPSTLIAAYPRQGRAVTLDKYHEMFQDYLQLQAYINNAQLSLDDPNQVDLFIDRARYSDFLHRVTREERANPMKRYKYRGLQLVETLRTKLALPDSPALLDSNKVNSGSPKVSGIPPPKKHFTRSTRRSTSGTPIQQIDLEDRVLEEEEQNSELVQLEEELYEMEVPPNPEARRIHSLYAAAIHRIGAGEQTDSMPTCIICNGLHRFEQCDVLNNTDFLRSHYIRFQQLRRRDAATRAASKLPEAPVSFVDRAGSLQDRTTFEETDSDEDMDFQLGRR